MNLNVMFEPEVWNSEWDTEIVEDEDGAMYRLALWERTHPREVMEILERRRKERKNKSST